MKAFLLLRIAFSRISVVTASFDDSLYGHHIMASLRGFITVGCVKPLTLKTYSLGPYVVIIILSVSPCEGLHHSVGCVKPVNYTTKVYHAWAPLSYPVYHAWAPLKLPGFPQ